MEQYSVEQQRHLIEYEEAVQARVRAELHEQAVAEQCRRAKIANSTLRDCKEVATDEALD